MGWEGRSAVEAVRRKRCPYCKSTNTTPAVAFTKKGDWTMDGRACDDCDMSFDVSEKQADGTWKKIPNEVRA